MYHVDTLDSETVKLTDITVIQDLKWIKTKQNQITEFSNGIFQRVVKYRTVIWIAIESNRDSVLPTFDR